jgi:hypothetical protein
VRRTRSATMSIQPIDSMYRQTGSGSRVWKRIAPYCAANDSMGLRYPPPAGGTFVAKASTSAGVGASCPRFIVSMYLSALCTCSGTSSMALSYTPNAS